MKFPQQYTEKNKETKSVIRITATQRSYEAHHIMCVAQVQKVVVGQKDTHGYADILDKTEWCVNNKKNMIALPLWAHTIKWYCNGLLDVLYDSRGNPIEQSLTDSLAKPNLLRPPFRNLPQHNYGHSGRTIKTSYNKENEKELVTAMRSLKKDKKNHDNERIKTLKSKLGRLSKAFSKKLKERGKCQYGGTHAAWKAGCRDPQSDWYKPFGMAQDPTPMTFPTTNFNRGMGEKVKALALNLWRWHTKFW